MSGLFKLHRGGQPGNQNARKHGFYSSSLDKEQRRILKQAGQERGLDGEIDLLRLKIKKLIQDDSDNVRLIAQASLALARLLRYREELSRNNGDDMSQGIENILNEIGVPFGLTPEKLYEWKLVREMRAKEELKNQEELRRKIRESNQQFKPVL